MSKIINQQITYIMKNGYVEHPRIDNYRIFKKPTIDPYTSSGRVIGEYIVTITNINGEDVLTSVAFKPTDPTYTYLELQTITEHVRLMREVIMDIELGRGKQYGL